MVSPVLGKRPPDRRDYRPFTWGHFLILRGWAQRVAEAEHAPVYLVGSALSQTVPRDVDVSIVLSRAEFEQRFGPLPDDPSPDAHRELWQATELAKAKHYCDIQEAVEYAIHVDVKFAPDCWYPSSDRLLLAEHP